MNTKTRHLSYYLILSKMIYDLDESLAKELDYVCIDNNSVALHKDYLSVSPKDMLTLYKKAYILLDKAKDNIVRNNKIIEEDLNTSIINLVEEGDKSIEEELHGKSLNTLIKGLKK